MDIATTRTWAEIDLDALEHNYKTITANLRGNVKKICVVKADAYGHGAVSVTRRLEKIGAEVFAVATAYEAFELREAGIKQPLLVLGVSPVSLAPEMAKLSIIQTVPDAEYARELSAGMKNTGVELPVHIKLDTGMGRIGMRETGEAALAAQLPGFKVDGVFTHFAVSDEPGGDTYTKWQYERFIRAVNEIERIAGYKINMKHCANSGGVVGFPDFHLDGVRMGIVLYGYSPFGNTADTAGIDTRVYTPQSGRGVINYTSSQIDLKPVMQLKTRIIQVKEMLPGEKISYGGIYTAKEHGKTAVIPIGYADGLRRSLSGKIEMLVRGKRVPQIGRICMDMCVLDVTSVPEVRAGDEVTVIGSPPATTASEAAELCGTIAYEILCAVSSRVPRVVI